MRWYQQLRWKLFFSHMMIIVVAVIVLLLTAIFVASINLPTKQASVGDSVTGLGATPEREIGQRQQFEAVVEQSLVIAGFAAVAVAVVMSVFVSSRVVDPLLRLSEVSQRLAQGYYRERTSLRSKDELGALSASINHLAATLQRSEEQRMRLIADVAHELRTPITTLEGYLEGLIDSILPREQETFLLMQGETMRLKRLTADLSLLSQAEAGALSVSLAPLDPRPLLERIAARYAGQFETCQIGFELELPPDLPPVEADRDRSEQVLVNLLTNALRYTPEGRQVTLGASANDEAVVIKLCDTGIGIAPNDLPYIFERFYRVDKSRARVSGGTGIGLTIARSLADAQGGALWAESAGVGQGATFFFALPRLLDDDPPLNEETLT